MCIRDSACTSVISDVGRIKKIFLLPSAAFHKISINKASTNELKIKELIETEAETVLYIRSYEMSRHSDHTFHIRKKIFFSFLFFSNRSNLFSRPRKLRRSTRAHNRALHERDWVPARMKFYVLLMRGKI